MKLLESCLPVNPVNPYSCDFIRTSVLFTRAMRASTPATFTQESETASTVPFAVYPVQPSTWLNAKRMTTIGPTTTPVASRRPLTWAPTTIWAMPRTMVHAPKQPSNQSETLASLHVPHAKS